MQALAVMVGAYAMVLVWAAMSVPETARETRARGGAVATATVEAGLELVRSVRMPGVPYTLTEVEARGSAT